MVYDVCGLLLSFSPFLSLPPAVFFTRDSNTRMGRREIIELILFPHHVDRLASPL